MKYYTIYILLLLSVLGHPATGQVDKIRNMQRNLVSINDSIQYVDMLNRISLLFYEQNIDSTLLYTVKARDIQEGLNTTKA